MKKIAFVFLCLCLFFSLKDALAQTPPQVKEQEYVLEIEKNYMRDFVQVIEKGEGEHITICWHGAGSFNRGENWDFFLNYGMDTNPPEKVIYAGLPGHGSVPVSVPSHYKLWTIDHFINIGVETAKKVSNGKKMTVVGHGLGGAVALGVALKAPELVDRVILIEPIISSNVKGMTGMLKKLTSCPPLARAMIGMNFKKMTKSVEGLRKSIVMAYVSDKEGFYDEPLVMEFTQNVYDYLSKAYGNEIPKEGMINSIFGVTRMYKKIDMRPMIEESKVNIPTLVLHGTTSKVVPLEQSRWLVKTLPNAELATVLRAGHMPQAENAIGFWGQVMMWSNAHPVK